MDHHPPQTSERNEGGMVVFKRHVLPMRERGIVRFLLDDVSHPYRLHRRKGGRGSEGLQIIFSELSAIKSGTRDAFVEIRHI